MNRNMFIVTLILFRVDATSDVHKLGFNKGILILEMHGTNKKYTCVYINDKYERACWETHGLRKRHYCILFMCLLMFIL